MTDFSLGAARGLVATPGWAGAAHHGGSGPGSGRAAPRHEAAPDLIERVYLFVALCILLADPFLVGGQPQGLQSLNPLKALKDMSLQGDEHKQIVLSVVYLGAIVLLVVRCRLRMLAFLGAPLPLLLAWCFLSMVWSAEPDLTFRRSVAVFGTAMLGLYAGLRFDLDEMLRVICRVSWVVLVGSMMLGAVLPFYGLDDLGRLRGVFDHKNALGGFAAVALLAPAARLLEAQYRSKLAKLRDALLAALCVAALALSHSAGPIPALALGLPLLASGRFVHRADRGMLALLPALAGVLVLSAVVAADNVPAIAEFLGRDANVSGRTDVWRFAATGFLHRPWLGYGYETFWGGYDSPGGVFWSLFDIGAPHSHNGYLQLAVDGGAVGLTLFSAALLTLCVRLVWLIRHGGDTLLAWVMGFIAFFLVINLAETRLWIGNQIDTVLFVFAVVHVNRALRRAVTERKWTALSSRRAAAITTLS